MEDWATHLLYLRQGRLHFFDTLENVPRFQKPQLSIYFTVEMWLREEEDMAAHSSEKEAAATGMLEHAQNRAGGYANGRLGGIYAIQ